MSLETELPARLMAFKNGDDYADEIVLVEVTDALVDGTIELAFTLSRAKLRVYLRLDALQAIRLAMPLPKSVVE